MTKTWNVLAEIENLSTLPSNLLLVDGNNLAFRWIQRHNHNDFKEDFIRTVDSLAKSYRAKRTIVCFDFGRSYYRNELIDTYKANRKKPDDPETAKRYNEFFGCLNTLPDYLSTETCKFRGLEADDIITYFCNNISEKYEHTWVISSDRDLYQLLSENTSIFNMFSRKEITLKSLKNEFDVTPSEYMLSRIIEGDKSDNITGVSGIGPKRAQSLARDYKTLNNLIKALPLAGRAKFIKNLNDSLDLLNKNEELICLKKYNEKIVKCAKNGDEVWETLEEVATNGHY